MFFMGNKTLGSSTNQENNNHNFCVFQNGIRVMEVIIKPLTFSMKNVRFVKNSIKKDNDKNLVIILKNLIIIIILSY